MSESWRLPKGPWQNDERPGEANQKRANHISAAPRMRIASRLQGHEAKMPLLTMMRL